MATSFDEFRTQFPLAREYTFLDHAAVSPLPACVARAMSEYLVKCQFHPKHQDEFHAILGEARATVAGLIHAEPDEIAFVENTATGISLAALGLPLDPGDEILLTDMEYPANVYPWMNLARHGIRVRVIPNRDGGLDVDALNAHATSRTRVVAVSSVEFLSGYRTDLAGLGRFCRERGIYFVVDAIQSLGVIPLDVKACQIDWLAAGGPKWLLGPKGQGFVFCRREIVDSIRPALSGAGGVVNEDAYLSYDPTPVASADRFQVGMLNSPGIVGLQAAVRMLTQVGIARIEERVLGLTAHLIDELTRRGLCIYSNLEPAHRSGIVTFHTPDAPALHAKLREERVAVSLRQDARGISYLRASPHGYNDEQDIERLLDVIDRNS